MIQFTVNDKEWHDLPPYVRSIEQAEELWKQFKVYSLKEVGEAKFRVKPQEIKDV